MATAIYVFLGLAGVLILHSDFFWIVAFVWLLDWLQDRPRRRH
jgi:hypothetical protein